MPKAITLEKGSPVFKENSVCSIDHTPFAPGDEVVICPKCKAVYHAECWTYNGNQCARLGCPGVGEVVYPTPITTKVLNTLVSALQAPSRLLSMTPSLARAISWLATMLLVYLLYTVVPWESALFFPSLVLMVTALFAVGTSTAYEAYQQKQYRGLVNDIAYWVQAFVLGFLGISAFNYLSQAFLPNLMAALGYPISPHLFAFICFILLTASMTHVGAWNNPQYFKKSTYVMLRFLAAITVVFLSTIAVLELWGWERGLRASPHSFPFYVGIAVGAALGSTLNSQLGLWTGKPQPGFRELVETLITTAILSGVGIILGQLVWLYLIQDSLLTWNGDTVDEAYRYFILSCAVIGAAYGSSDQAHNGLLGLFRFTTKITLIGAALAIVVVGGYLSYVIAQEQFDIIREDYLIWVALGGAALTFVILRALYGFFKEVISS